MAYIDFARDAVFADQHPTPRHDPAPTADAGLSALEWSVVALARGDRVSSLARPSRLSIALGTVFGAVRPNPHLADPRLEALRRMAVLSWHRGFAVPIDELRAFHAAGFSADQYETMLASISVAQSRRQQQRAGARQLG